MSDVKLTAKQETFAQEVASGKTQSDAYRAAFNVRPNTKPESVNQAASKLMANTNISSRVDELRAPIVEKVGLTLEKHLQDLLTLRNVAAKNNSWSAAISAEIARGKAAGVHIEKTMVENIIRTLPPLLDEDWL